MYCRLATANAGRARGTLRERVRILAHESRLMYVLGAERSLVRPTLTRSSPDVLPIGRDPIRRDLPLRFRQRHFAVTGEVTELLLELVLTIGVSLAKARLRPQVGRVLRRAGQAQRH
jgi:hypothetical protein